MPVAYAVTVQAMSMVMTVISNSATVYIQFEFIRT